ncbi:unnamed protein product [Trifolium pratense]|uniref:Uncharacterized protein n=1 Tax=Trifolium pratense TaxID=57577 RepID=A0ACB0KYE1_TRIPR|nr:unnamed protein product [Trifolium pratense]
MSRRERQRRESPDSYTPSSSPGSDIEEAYDVNPLRIELSMEDWADIEVRNATSKYSDFNSALACILNFNHPSTRALFDIQPCYEGYAVCDSPSEGEHACFTYVYYCIFSKLGVRIPFTNFQCEILRTLNVAPTQLHPNGWGCVRAFEILCDGLGLPLSAYSFFSCFQAKSLKSNSWIYISNKAKHTLISPLTSSWKHFKNDFICVFPSPTSPLWYDDSGAPFFPFHWTKRPVTKPDLCSLPHSTEDREAVAVLRAMQTVTVAKLLLYEHNTAQLSAYLRSEEMDQCASVPAGDANPTSLKKQKRKNSARNEVVLAAASTRASSPIVTPRPIAQFPIPTGTSTLPARNWRAKLAIEDRGGESQSAWDVHFSGEGVIPHYTTSSDVHLIKDIRFEQSLEAIRTYSLWSAALANETNKILKEQRIRYVTAVSAKTDAIETLNASL